MFQVWAQDTRASVAAMYVSEHQNEYFQPGQHHRQRSYVRQRTEIVNTMAQSPVSAGAAAPAGIPSNGDRSMPSSSAALGNVYSRLIGVTQVHRKSTALAIGLSIVATLGACSNVSALTKERVAQSDTSVQQAQQSVGRSEAGAIELQQARDKLSEAKNALAKDRQQEAERAAAQAHLYAELAIAKTQSASARAAAEEVLASLNMLRTETERTSPTQR